MHPEMIERMMRWLDQEAQADDKRVLQAHLIECVSCANEWASLFAIHQQMSNVSMLAPAPGFANRVMQRLAQQEQQRITQRTLIGVPVLAFGSLALLMLVIRLSPFGDAVFSGDWTTLVNIAVLFGALVEALVRVVNALGGFILDRIDQTTVLFMAFATLVLTLIWARMVSGTPFANRRIS